MPPRLKTPCSTALNLFQRLGSSIDAVITDVVMPGMSGPDLIVRMREHAPLKRVLYISGYSRDAVLRYGILREDPRFLQKPFKIDALMDSIREMFSRDPR